MAVLQHQMSGRFYMIVPNVTRLRNRVDLSDGKTVEILDSIERDARITLDIFSRMQKRLRETPVEQTDINSVLNEVAMKTEARWSKEAIPSSVRLTLVLDEDVPQTRAPIGHLAEVFQNLLDNAYRAAIVAGGEVNVSSCFTDGTLYVRVRDTGPGIQPPIADRLCQKPVPSGGLGGGSGLGLWLSRLILRSLGGDVEIESTSTTIPTGTTMLVRIPVAAAREEAPPSVSGGSGATVRTRILIIDDEPRWIDYAVSDLREFEIVVADDAEAVIAELEADRIDLVIASSQRLDMLETIRQRYADKRVVVMTVQPTTQEALTAYRLGAIRYLPKSFGRRDLLKRIRDLIVAAPDAG